MHDLMTGQPTDLMLFREHNLSLGCLIMVSIFFVNDMQHADLFMKSVCYVWPNE